MTFWYFTSLIYIVLETGPLLSCNTLKFNLFYLFYITMVVSCHWLFFVACSSRVYRQVLVICSHLSNLYCISEHIKSAFCLRAFIRILHMSRCRQLTKLSFTGLSAAISAVRLKYVCNDKQ